MTPVRGLHPTEKSCSRKDHDISCVHLREHFVEFYITRRAELEAAANVPPAAAACGPQQGPHHAETHGNTVAADEAMAFGAPFRVSRVVMFLVAVFG
jgi:hypothetical protein